MKLEVALSGREQMSLEIEVDAAGMIQRACLQGIGGPQFLRQLAGFRQRLKGVLSQVEMPTGRDVASLMFCELLLRARGEFHYPYTDPELCHCRSVSTRVVDDAILTGAHTPEKVSRLTSASTACGTCRPDVESMLKFRFQYSQQ